MTAPAAIATAAATPMAVPEKMHVEVAGFAGFGEFHGSTVDCSADAELMARHPLDGSPLDAATLNAWWHDYLLTGHGDEYGARLSGIYWHLTASAHKLDPGKARVAAYIPTDSATLDALHDNLKAALARGQTVIVYLGNAQALPYNERNVHGHFVAIGGIDSDQGYLVGNGDDVNALGGKNVIGARWYGWNQLAAAQINGMIALAKVGTGSATGGSTVTTTEPTPTVQSEYQEILALRKEIYSLKDQLTAAHTQVDQQYQEILALRKQIGDLKGQLAHPPTPPTSTPPTPVPDPKAVAALAAITELAKALKLAGGQAA